MKAGAVHIHGQSTDAFTQVVEVVAIEVVIGHAGDKGRICLRRAKVLGDQMRPYGFSIDWGIASKNNFVSQNNADSNLSKITMISKITMNVHSVSSPSLHAVVRTVSA